jgi:hypothetical protein
MFFWEICTFPQIYFAETCTFPQMFEMFLQEWSKVYWLADCLSVFLVVLGV